MAAKYYKRGQFAANKSIKIKYFWQGQQRPVSTSLFSKTRFVKTLIARGIGYRTFALNNDLLSGQTVEKDFADTLRPIFTDPDLDESQELSQVGRFEFSYPRYLSVRAGHTRDLYLPLHKAVYCLTLKKDRKLVISSMCKTLSSDLTKTAHCYRKPSAYTGRGVRIKHVRPVRKAGKKDKQRGRRF